MKNLLKCLIERKKMQLNLVEHFVLFYQRSQTYAVVFDVTCQVNEDKLSVSWFSAFFGILNIFSSTFRIFVISLLIRIFD